MRLYVSSILLALLAGTGCAAMPTTAAAPAERELTEADRDLVEVRVGEVLVVRAGSNPSTGYGWEWDQAAASGVLVQEGETSMAGMQPIPGSGGTQTWRFRAVAPGQGELHLDYLRPWEKDQAPARTLRWRVQVR